MGTTISVHFPLGRYHATRWDGGANTSDVEWPPAPWRILRALIAVWYNRWPDLPAADLDSLLIRLGSPSAYSTPPVLPGSTRHYMPGVSHSRGATGNTDLVIDAFLALPPDEPVLIHWNVDLHANQRATFAKLLELLPYLGRSESVCEAALLDGEIVPDANWWRMGEVGEGVEQVELLAPDGPNRRDLLEATTVATRRERRLLPIGARRISYGRTPPPTTTRIGRHRSLARIAPPAVGYLRFELSSPVPVHARNVILATDAMHSLIAKALIRAEVDDAVEFVGLEPVGSARRAGHDHVHVAPVPPSALLRARETIRSLIVWRPQPMTNEQASAIIDGARVLYSRTGTGDRIATQQLLFAGSGDVADLEANLGATATNWISAMPYLPVRHRKKNRSDDDFLTDDIAFECRYRNLPVPIEVARVNEPHLAGEIVQFRRRRAQEDMRHQRRGVYLRLRFEHDVRGPIAFGQLSHFGFGLFLPDRARRTDN